MVQYGFFIQLKKGFDMTTPTLSEQDIFQLRELYPKLSSLHRTLESFANPTILDQIKGIMDIHRSVFAPIEEAENKAWDIKFNAFSKIAEEHNFISTWSIYETSIDLENEQFPHKLAQISYQGVVKTFDKPIKLSYLDLWHIANQLIVESKDLHHIYIECFKPVHGKKGHFELITGS